MIVTMSVEQIDLPSVAPLPRELDVDVLVLPRKIEDGQGLYDDSVVTIAKELRAAGVTADYQHGPDSREWIGEKAIPLFVVDLFAAVAGHAGWDGLRAVFRDKHSSDRVRIRVVRYVRNESGVRFECFKLDGTGKEVAEALETLERSPRLELDSGDG